MSGVYEICKNVDGFGAVTNNPFLVTFNNLYSEKNLK